MKKFPILFLLLVGFAAGAQENHVKFAFITDNHNALGSPAIAGLGSIIADINTQKDIEFVLFGGDLTDFGTDEELAQVKSQMDSLKCKYYAVAGNHDAKWSESGCNTVLKVFGYEHFELNAGGWRILGCNSGPDMRMAPALLPQETKVWLETLQPDRKTIVVNHYPQDSSVLNYFDNVREFKRIDTRLVIGGHWHKNKVMDYDGLPGILGRSALASGNVPGYNIVTLDGDHISVSERRVYKGGAVLMAPWYEKDLAHVVDTVKYDAHGLPASYPWMRYDVNENYPQVKEMWRFKENSNIVAGFARSGDTAWYATSSGSLRSISVKDGHRIWSKDFPGKIFSTPAYDSGIVVFGCADGYIYGVNASLGSTVWKVKAGKSVLGSPAIHNGKVYIGASDGVFRAINLKSGTVAWEYSGVKGFVESRPFVDDKQVVFGTWGNSLYSLNPETGALQWVWKVKGSRMISPAATWPVKAAGRIFVAVPNRKVYAIDAKSGKQLFVVDGGREAIGISEDGKTIYAKSMFNKSYAFRADGKGSKLWEVKNNMGYEISPTAIVEKDGIVLTPSDKGNLIALSAKDGSFLWAHKISVALINPMEVWTSGNTMNILASTMDGVVTLLNL